MLFFRGREWGNPSRVSAYVLFMVIIVIGQLSATDKKKNPNTVSVYLKFLAFNLNYFFCSLPFKEEEKKSTKFLFPCLYGLYIVLSIFYHTFS